MVDEKVTKEKEKGLKFEIKPLEKIKEDGKIFMMTADEFSRRASELFAAAFTDVVVEESGFCRHATAYTDFTKYKFKLVFQYRHNNKMGGVEAALYDPRKDKGQKEYKGFNKYTRAFFESISPEKQSAAFVPFFTDKARNTLIDFLLRNPKDLAGMEDHYKNSGYENKKNWVHFGLANLERVNMYAPTYPVGKVSVNLHLAKVARLVLGVEEDCGVRTYVTVPKTIGVPNNLTNPVNINGIQSFYGTVMDDILSFNAVKYESVKEKIEPIISPGFARIF